MKLEKWALIAEIVGALAIVVSLLFVGLQIRQSNSLAATDALKEGTRIWTDAYVAAFGTEESTELFRKAVRSCDTLSPEEHGRFAYYGIASTPCAQKVLVEQIPLLPSYLIRPDDIPALVGHQNDIKLFDFLVE